MCWPGLLIFLAGMLIFPPRGWAQEHNALSADPPGTPEWVWQAIDIDVSTWRGEERAVLLKTNSGMPVGAEVGSSADGSTSSSTLSSNRGPDSTSGQQDYRCLMRGMMVVRLDDNPSEANRNCGARNVDEVNTGTPLANSLKVQAGNPEKESIEWGHLMLDSTKFLLFLHAWRVATEKDTRDGLSGPFFRDYALAVQNIHGWSDGDPFDTNYIHHPMEGSVAGYLEVAHDPRYRTVEIGKSPEYWKSRLRAMAFAAAFSLQFEIGPISEASIGNIQREKQKTGIVDWVITPTMGFAWMIGEDALDKYFIQKMEVRTTNHLARIVLRSALNPSRSFANMMRGKCPWIRDTRPGVFQF